MYVYAHLRGDADRAGVEVALAHHDATERDERRRGETELLSAQQTGDGNVLQKEGRTR